MSGPTKEQIESKLEWALTEILGDHRRAASVESDDAYYLQFESVGLSSGSERAVFLDMPCKMLTDGQCDRAFKAFASRGLEGPQEIKALNENGTRKTMLAAWRFDCGSNPELAAKISLAILVEIFGEPKWSELHADIFELHLPDDESR